MNDVEQRAAAREFVAKYENIMINKGSEKQFTQSFWIDFLRDVFGIKNTKEFIAFEKPVKLKNISYIDGYIKSTNVLIEQKSKGVDLLKPIKQSDGSFLTPFEQAKRYANELSYSERIRWIVTCNFEKFLVYDMDRINEEPQEILLKDLGKEYYRLGFLVKPNTRVQKEMEVSIKAGELIGKIYDALLKQYQNPTREETLKSLNVLCVRLVFCMYAEDAGIFGERNMFLDYLREFDAGKMRGALIDLFKTLDTPDKEPNLRSPYLDDSLARFPYVNGGLFTDDSIEIPKFTDEIRDLLLEKASSGFDWSYISPTIFGALFESTLNPVTRRSGGMHYTSVENIHKVIDSLFLNDLATELDKILAIKVKKDKRLALLKYQDKLANLKFLDPACGSGNFLTETYLCLRRLENKAIDAYYGGERVLGDLVDVIKVSIDQFFGIEINDFAVTVAKTAMWIAESQMMKETEDIIHETLEYLPLKSYVNIVEANALRIDWEDVVPKAELNYIMGNPPFAGRRYRTEEQIRDVAMFFRYKDIDYVACWYKKASDLIQDTNIKCAYVSTNSITQGEQVAALWEVLNVKINFAYRTFKWVNEAKNKAAVNCVIIGFACGEEKRKYIILNNGSFELCNNINGYLVAAPDIYLKVRTKPLGDAPLMRNGNVPLDGDALKVEPNDIGQFKDCVHLLKRLIGGRELLYNEPRYVLWLVGVSPKEITKYSSVYQRVKLCRENRLAMKDKGTQKLADSPTTFRDTQNPDNYIALPMVSSERRAYIPMEYFHNDTIPTNQVQIILDAGIYHFGVLMSNIHNAWMRAVAGRLEMRYRYSKEIVYNNFPWCNSTEAQRAKIEKTAQGILDARALYPNSNLADLYGALYLYPELRKAHQANDHAVMEAYGFAKDMSESEIVAELMKMYKALTKE